MINTFETKARPLVQSLIKREASPATIEAVLRTLLTTPSHTPALDEVLDLYARSIEPSNHLKWQPKILK